MKKVFANRSPAPNWLQPTRFQISTKFDSFHLVPPDLRGFATAVQISDSTIPKWNRSERYLRPIGTLEFDCPENTDNRTPSLESRSWMKPQILESNVLFSDAAKVFLFMQELFWRSLGRRVS